MAHQDQDKVIIRMPDGMRDSVHAAAKANGRSANAEIVARLGGSGKTLRDEFAMAALGALLRIEAADTGQITWAAVADDAYAMADAMLAERQKDAT